MKLKVTQTFEIRSTEEGKCEVLSSDGLTVLIADAQDEAINELMDLVKDFSLSDCAIELVELDK